MQKIVHHTLAAFLVAGAVIGGLLVVAAAFILMALLAMAVWAVLIGGLGWLVPGIMEPLRAMAGLQDFSFWQIGAGIGFLMTVLRGVFGMAHRHS